MASSIQKTHKRPTNFLEALQNLGKEVVSDARDQVSQVISSDLPDALGLSAKPTSGPLNPNESFSLEDILSAEKRGEQTASRTFSLAREEERVAALRREEEAKSHIKSLLTEIQSLAKSLGDLGHEVQIAALQAPANPGIYHRSFFDQLRSFIKALRQRVQDSRHWLATQNARSRKRQGVYWGNVQKSGTKYMLSGERYMVTTTG